MSAPASSRIRAASTWPKNAARCKAVHPSCALPLTSMPSSRPMRSGPPRPVAAAVKISVAAPCSSSAWTMSWWTRYSAAMRGVSPLESRRVASSGCADSSRRTPARFPDLARSISVSISVIPSAWLVVGPRSSVLGPRPALCPIPKPYFLCPALCPIPKPYFLCPIPGPIPRPYFPCPTPRSSLRRLHPEQPRPCPHVDSISRAADFAVHVVEHLPVRLDRGRPDRAGEDAGGAVRGSKHEVAAAPQPGDRVAVLHDQRLEHAVVHARARRQADAVAVFAAVGEGDQQRIRHDRLAVEDD